MQVTKRDGRREPVQFDKITRRLAHLRDVDHQPALGVDVTKVAASVCAAVCDGISTTRLDELAAEVAAGLSTDHPDYGALAARVLVSNLQKNTSDSVADTFVRMGDVLDPDMVALATDLEAAGALDFVDYDRDYDLDFFGFKTMEKMYLTRVRGVVVERPQHMWLRVALALWGRDVDRVRETYELMSRKRFTHASPTLFNAGCKRSQCSSCFAAGTRVCTTNRGVVNIEDVRVGDRVVTHAGGVKTVEQVHANPLGGRILYDVQVFKTPVLTVTGNHRFWAQKMSGKKVRDGVPGWYAIEDLREGDYIAIPRRVQRAGPQTIDAYRALEAGMESLGLRSKYRLVLESDMVNVDRVITRPDWLNDRASTLTCHVRCNGIKACWDVTEDFAWFLGVWYGDGCVVHKGGSNEGAPSYVSFAAHPDNHELIERVCRVGRVVFGVRPNVHVQSKQKLTSIAFHSKPLAIVFRHLFGHGHLGKRLHVGAFDWDKSMVEALIGGLVSSDGCVTSGGTITMALTNRPLMEAVYHAARQVGIDVSLHTAKKRPDLEYCPTWSMTVPFLGGIRRHVLKRYADERMSRESLDRTHTKTAVIDGTVFLRLDRKRASTREDVRGERVVYTLGVADDHSYNVEGLMCENCFLMGVEDDSIEGIFDAITKCAHISKWGGGIGIHVSGVRSKGARILGTNGTSDGLVPMLRVLNATAAYVNQGGRRKGSVAVYIEPHHPDFLDVIAMKRNVGDEHLRARDLFYAAWISDLFMRRVEADAAWSFFDPAACPGLADAWGDEYVALYERYEAEGLATRTARARDVWFEILRSQIETGTPYLLMKDACNAKSNQQNMGTIKCSNLCSEIVQFTAADEVAVCNLASLSLPAFVSGSSFDFAAFEAAVRVLARNLDRVIDINYYPVPEARTSNERHRPVGIGVQGLQDAFFMLRLPFDSPEAAVLNRHIFESLYHAALSESCALARERGRYSSFEGSPASQGRLQFDLWGVTPSADHPARHDWAGLKADIAVHGLRNSLSIAPMPTASTANIFGNVESTEPVTSNVYSRRTLAGEFAVVNKHLVRDLMARGLWTPATKNAILANEGSVQHVPGLPDDVRRLYRTAWELSMKAVIDMAADRGAFVCQSQSMNVFVAEPTFKKLSSMFFHAWKRGLKTCAYYLRSRPAAKAVQVTVRDCVACSG